MGGKYPRKRKYLFLYYSCLLIILLLHAGCAFTAKFIDRGQANLYLKDAERQVLAGNFQAAIKNDQRVLEIFPKCYPGDRALFHLGLIFAHPENPQKDNEKSLYYFANLVRDFPESDLKIWANVWSVTLTSLIDKEADLKKTQHKVGILQEQIEVNDKTIGNLLEQLKKIKEIDIITEEGKRQELTE